MLGTLLVVRDPVESQQNKQQKFHPSGTLAVSAKENHIAQEEEIKFCWSEGH